MSDSLTASAPPSKTGLTVFGVLGILFGFLLLALAAFLLAMASLGDRLPNSPGVTLKNQIPGVLVIVGGGFLFAALGWGTLKARRWARNLSLIVGWAWLTGGILGMIVILFMMPTILNPPGVSPLGPGGNMFVGVMVFLVSGVLYLVLPALGLGFYHHPKVRRAFEAYGPGPDWTDACPPSVLAVSLCNAVGGVFLALYMSLTNFGWPFFGRMLWGGWGFLALAVQLPVLAYLAWGIYRLQRRAWILSLVLNALWSVSVVWTYATVDLADLNRKLGFSEQAVARMAGNPLMTGPAVAGISGAACLLWFLYLLGIGKHFPRD